MPIKLGIKAIVSLKNFVHNIIKKFKEFYTTMNSKQQWVYFGAIIVLVILVFGVYILPENHALVPVKNSNEDGAALQISIMANQISSMNYLLTFIGLAGAIAGVAFTIFGYYQSTKFREMVEEEVDKRIKNFEEKELENNHSIMNEVINKEIEIYTAIFKDKIQNRALEIYSEGNPDINIFHLNNEPYNKLWDFYIKSLDTLLAENRSNQSALIALKDAANSILEVSQADEKFKLTMLLNYGFEIKSIESSETKYDKEKIKQQIQKLNLDFQNTKKAITESINKYKQ
ncbi:hypothetical protein SAMN05444392_11810 [Seinonella peptonophila]|uniref:Uncharacterized protein n=2 Tax=Seinonella peptonophila TaxID=112248 RepID=A0A1M5B3U5_9BACL|nr:hypothetical protein SAMN05444392_11810 [Seinonella peptonophila]